MLKLKRVELQGFKSFCDRSEMKFHGSGVAAVVGPNGCGKSNISDAISWVLGEQSARSLRGAQMSDVIFAGTRDRKPVGMASVTLTMVDPNALDVKAVVNEDGQTIATEEARKKPQEITITRRLYRSGESEYLINGRVARLRDIQDLFMGSGLGPESYAIIEQGRIGQILSTKPQDRRAVIEEAAGITRFKTKRRLAEAKLDGAKQNLTRVFDILEEVTRQVNSLKRQAAKAKRYDELRTELVEQLRIALSGRFRLLEREAARVALDLNVASAKFQDLSAELAEREREQASVQFETRETEAALTGSRKSLADQRLEAERARGKLEFQTKQVHSLEQRLTQGTAEAQHLAERAHTIQAELTVHTTTLQELEQQGAGAKAQLAAKEQERQQIHTQLREQERIAEAARGTVLKLLGEGNTLRNQLAQINEFLQSVERDAGRAQREDEVAAADVGRFTTAKNELQSKLQDRQLSLQNTAEQRRTVEEELQVSRSRLTDTRRRLDQSRSEAARLKARHDSLNEVISHRSYTTDAVKRLFKAIEKGQGNGLQPLGVLADFIEVDPGYEKAVEEFLHEELEYVVVRDFAQASAGIDLLRSDVDGRATFFVRPAEVARCETAAIDGFAPLTSVLRLSEGMAEGTETLLPRVARCYLAGDRASAEQVAPRHPDAFFLTPDGVCFQGWAVSGGKKSGAGPLALKRELRDVQQQLTAKQKELDQTGRTLEGLEEQIAGLQEDLEQLRAQQQVQERDSLTISMELKKLGEELSRANSRMSVARMELQRLRQQQERSNEQRERNQTQLESVDTERHRQESVGQNARELAGVLQAKAVTVGEEHATARVQVAGLEERRRAEQSAQQRLQHQERETQQRAENLHSEMERWTAERARLEAENEDLAVRGGELTVSIADLERTVAQLAEQDQVYRGQLSTLNELLKRLRAGWQETQEQRSQLEVTLVKHQEALKYLEETCRKEMQMGLEELAQGVEIIPPEDELVEAEKRAQEIRTKIDNLGPVNAQALEEFQEAQQRFEFLQAQRQDLLDSIRDTEKAIREIDIESKRRFTEAFHAINANFREMFKTLFAGGIGEMRLNDEENVIESGIDIVAQPPSKKLQSVLLLSGGEKALTAMALLMAIFRYQPSPFCVLDEVDAPLDEPNTERLNRLVREMASHTQFIIITHSKRTMEMAEALYGVTMQEPGVSKLVSVKFEPLAKPQVLPPLAQPAEEAAVAV